MEKLAINGGSPAKTTATPVWPIYDDNERQALMDVLESRIWWRTPGTQTKAFEQEFAAFQQAEYGIAVTNGTAALEVALAALGVGPGDEVIVPNFTFIATASAVLTVGAMPVMVDCTADTYCIDVHQAEAAVTIRTKAIIAVHLGGHPADMDALLELCSRKGLLLVEDSSHAHGSEWKGRRVGAISDIGTFSFQASKLLTAGEGGVIITNNPDLERKARSLHDCGRLPGEWFYSHFNNGSNYRLSEWQGAVLRCQLSRADEQLKIRSENADFLDDLLSKIEGITPQRKDPRCTLNGHYAYIFHVDSKAFSGSPVSRFIQALNAEGVPTQASYPPVNECGVFQSEEFRKRLSGQQAQQDYSFLKSSFPNTLRGAWETVWLPQPVLLGSEEDMRMIVAAVKKIQEQASDL